MHVTHIVLFEGYKIIVGIKVVPIGNKFGCCIKIKDKGEILKPEISYQNIVQSSLGKTRFYWNLFYGRVKAIIFEYL